MTGDSINYAEILTRYNTNEIQAANDLERFLLRGELPAPGSVARAIVTLREPARHGHWIDDSGEGDAAVCSCCGECYDTTEAECDWRKAFGLFCELYRYCPNCGAKMDEEVAGDD